MNYIGIDCGLGGGIAILQSDAVTTLVTPTVPHPSGKGNRREYDISMMVAILRPYKLGSMVFIEQAQAMPGQGVVSMFSIGKGYGMWLGVLTALEIPYQTVPSRRWSCSMLEGISKGDTKAAAAIVCSRLFPKHSLRATERSKKAHEGMADALLIAEWGRRQRQPFLEKPDPFAAKAA